MSPFSDMQMRGGLEPQMTTLTAVVEQDPETGLYVGMVPGLPGAHSQGATLDELMANLKPDLNSARRILAGFLRQAADFIEVGFRPAPLCGAK